MLERHDAITLADIVSVKAGGEALLAGNEAECTGLRVVALAVELSEKKQPDQGKRNVEAIRKYLRVCRKEDLVTVAQRLSEPVYLQVVAENKGKVAPRDMTVEKTILAEALYECAKRLPDAQTTDARMLSLLKPHLNGKGGIGKAEMEMIQSRDNERANTVFGNWFKIEP